MGYVPIVVEIKPDELLYSWICRLADANALGLRVFGRAYLRQQGIYTGELPYEIKRDYVTLMECIRNKPDMAELYEDHSTLRFDLMFVNERMGIKYINNVCLNPDSLNVTKETVIRKIHICPDCVKEDAGKYGFPYLHVSHHLQGVKACPFHNRMLMEYTGSRGHECECKPDDYDTIPVQFSKKPYIDYAVFSNALFSSGIDVPLESVKEAFVKELVSRGYALHQDGYKRFESDFSASEYASLLEKDVRFCFEQYLIKKKAFAPQDFLPLLMFLFENPQKLIDALGPSEPVLIDTICKVCEKSYISHRNTAYTRGLCRNCYSQIPISVRFRNLVQVVGGGEYEPAEEFTANMKRMKFKHSCGRISSFIPNNFLYQYSRCECEVHTDEAWKKGYDKLLEYYDEFGTVNIPKRKSYNGYNLGAWCQSVRGLKYAGNLSSDKELLLIDLGFDFAPFKSAWERNLDAYKEYVKTTGTGHIERPVTYKGVDLGTWYSNQKKKYSNGTLKKERLEQIRSIYPDFPKTPAKERKFKEVKYHPQPFETTLKLLLEYEKEFGTLIVPKRHSYKGYHLGAWCQQMRSKRRLGTLPQEQIEALDKVGFIWDAAGHKWQEDMDRYRAYVNETGKCDVTREEVFNGFKMGHWYQNLKIARKKGTLTDEQRADITKINPKFFS